MKGKPDVNQFLTGAGTESGEAVSVKVQAAIPQIQVARRANKTIRLAADLERVLKDLSYQRSRDSGQRVTESDIIEEALRKYLNA